MNARIKEKKEPNNFKPFTLEIDVDTLDELKYLWMAFNINVESVKEHNKYIKKSITEIGSIGTSKHDLWKKLDSKLLESME